jgi:hypothetical protein
VRRDHYKFVARYGIVISSKRLNALEQRVLGATKPDT